jgi:hypothetical protein
MFPYRNFKKTETSPAKEMSEKLPEITGQKARYYHVRG